MSWLYGAANVEVRHTSAPDIDRVLVDAAFAWQRAGVRPTVTEMLLLSPAERNAWIKAGELREVADRGTPTEMAADTLAAWQRGDL